MKEQTFTLITGEQVHRLEHPSGLTMLVYPKAGYRSSYALFGTRYGSVDTAFVKDGERIEVPAGIAHYLEHKLFENEDCDAFQRYAETGASANAFTSFDMTAYLFGCADNFEASLEILLDFVQKPYFTKETVQKEQGIIGQEIRMCDDSPDRRVLFNLLRTMYETHPVRVDIAGTVESISHITAELLYDCYYTFYNLHNMVLCVCGNVDVETVKRVADRVLIPAKPLSLDMPLVQELKTVRTPYAEETMPVAAPLFYLGYKLPVDGMYLTETELVASELIVDLLTAPSSELYTSMMRDGLINDSYDGELFEGRSFAMVLIGGENNDPLAVQQAIRRELSRLQQTGIDSDRFEELRASLYGRSLRRYNSVEGAAMAMMDDHFHGRTPFATEAAIASLTAEDVNRLVREWMIPEHEALSVIKAKEDN